MNPNEMEEFEMKRSYDTEKKGLLRDGYDIENTYR